MQSVHSSLELLNGDFSARVMMETKRICGENHFAFCGIVFSSRKLASATMNVLMIKVGVRAVAPSGYSKALIRGCVT